MDERNWRAAASNAIRYWEPRRIIYNVVLAAIAIAYFAAYLADVFFQLSDYHQLWQKYRWILFVIGTVFAGIITRVFSIGFFDAAPH